MQRKNVHHKFGAIRCTKNGHKFASKLEANYYTQLLLRQKAGEVLFFLMQTPFHLPGDVQYRVDFVVFLANGEVEFIDCKGMDTPVSNIKIKMVQDLYPLEIKIVRRV